MTSHDQLAGLFRDEMRKQGLTYRAVGDRCGMDISAVHGLLHRKTNMTLATADRVAKALGKIIVWRLK